MTPLVYEIFCGVAGGRGGDETSCEGAFILVHHLIDLRCPALIGTATITSNIDAISGAVVVAQGGDTAPDLYRRMAITRPYRRAVLFFYYEKNEITYASAFSCTGRWP